MYTVKEVSEILEVRRQTVYVYLKDMSSELKDHTFKIKGATHMDEEGIRITKTALGVIQVPTVEEKEISIDKLNEILKALKVKKIDLDMTKGIKKILFITFKQELILKAFENYIKYSV